MADAFAPLECPVCEEYFTNPKLLECNHVLCAKCIVDWLTSAGPLGGCPLCRAPILPLSASPSSPGSARSDSPSSKQQCSVDDSENNAESSKQLSSSDQSSIRSLVDALPTHKVMAARVESEKMLSGQHVCMYCDNQTAVTSFCLQCSMKLCTTCAKSHRKFPTMKNHTLEDLNNLTAQRLVETNRVMCRAHDDRLAEVYCPDHQWLLCSLCASTIHRACSKVATIADADAEMREKLRLDAEKMREKERRMREEVKQRKDMFVKRREEANKIFDDLVRSVEARRQEVLALVQSEEEHRALQQLERDRAAFTSQAGVLENLVTEAGDGAVLEMECSMADRLTQLEQLTFVQGHDPGEITYSSQLSVIQSCIEKLGQIEDANQERSVVLERDAKGSLGFKVTGGQMEPLTDDPIMVSHLLPDGPAVRSAKFKVGDRIVKINEVSTDGMEHHTAVELLKTPGPVTLHLRQDEGTLIGAEGSRSQQDLASDPAVQTKGAEKALQRKIVTLEKGSDGLGFSIVGGQGSPGGDLPIYVKNALPKAWNAGLSRGDQILSVNGEVTLDGVTHQEAAAILKNSCGKVTLIVLRS